MTLNLDTVYLGDCLEVMKDIPDKSIDMILCDLPYGTTACKWDTIIPFEPLWEQYKRIIKDNGAIVLTASQPFTSALIMSNINMFKYCWIWDKINASNFFAAKFQPLNNTEDIVIFGYGGCNNGTKNALNYKPQDIIKINKPRVNSSNKGGILGRIHKSSMYKGREIVQEFTGYPYKTLKYYRSSNNIHPTQKPVPLFEYLIKTYTNEGDLVLDNCMGSGTTAIACINTNRNYICMEKDEGYFEKANARINTLLNTINTNSSIKHESEEHKPEQG